MDNSCNNASQLCSCAMERLRTGNLTDAANLLEQAVSRYPADAQAWYLLGAAYGMQGRNAECEFACRKVIRLQPHAFTTWNNLGNALAAQGRVDDARAAYQQALALHPDYAEAMNNLGNLERGCGNADSALQLFRKALSIQPDNPQAHNNLGNVLKDNGDFEAAAHSYAMALQLEPAYPDALINIGILHQLREDLPQARQCYEQALALRPDHPETLFNLGMIHQMQGTHEAARECFQRTLALDPGHANASYFLASIDGRNVPPVAPSRYVIDLFDTYADRFDEHLVSDLQYRTPEQLFSLVQPHLPAATQMDILDLGCGTGLSGAAFHTVCRHMTGVDLSPKMIDRTRQRGIYDSLHVSDLLPVLTSATQQFDLVISTDVFIYIGDISRIFAATWNCLRPGGLFCFSIENSAGPDDFVLRTSGRYAQSPRYIEKLARTSGFTILENADTTIRMERGRAITGRMYVLRRKSDG